MLASHSAWEPASINLSLSAILFKFSVQSNIKIQLITTVPNTELRLRNLMLPLNHHWLPQPVAATAAALAALATATSRAFGVLLSPE